MTAILFLDVDGVLNHRACFSPSRGGSPLCPDAIARLQGLVKRTQCHVVLSSTWRTMDGFVDRLAAAGGFPRPHPTDWRTIEMPPTVKKGQSPGPSVLVPGVNIPKRGDEIAEWLSRHPEVGRYAIVDDDADMLPEQLPFFVQTTFETGLLDEHVAKLEQILKGESDA
jgi:hypothetical protein